MFYEFKRTLLRFFIAYLVFMLLPLAGYFFGVIDSEQAADVALFFSIGLQPLVLLAPPSFHFSVRVEQTYLTFYSYTTRLSKTLYKPYTVFRTGETIFLKGYLTEVEVPYSKKVYTFLRKNSN